jgi:ABC-type nickel/cobalt efflux system permease component RcnA
VGRAIADARSKTERRAKYRAVAVIVLIAWVGYVFAMTVLRTDLIADFYFQRYQKPLEGTLEIAIFIFSVLILVGLGLWVLVRAMNSNPHKSRYSRLKYVYFNKQRAHKRAEAARAKAEAV